MTEHSNTDLAIESEVPEETQAQFPTETSEAGFRALDLEFDAAVVSLARECLPGGFDVGAIAPQTYDDLVRHMESGERLKVWSGASGHTIYGSPAVNHHFLAWHDYIHWRRRHAFTFVGEMSVMWLQAEQMRRRYANHPRYREWRAWLFAEVGGQLMYADVNGNRFPGNQRLFARRFAEVLLDTQPELPGGSK